MKSTGIVRRVDDLGRVVIPKEIRRDLKIKEGEPLELFLEGRAVCFRKFDKTLCAQESLNELKTILRDEDAVNSAFTEEEHKVIDVVFELIKAKLQKSAEEDE